MSRILKFRMWNPVGHEWLFPNDKMEDWFGGSSKAINLWCYDDGLTVHGLSRGSVVIEQFTGIKDANGKDIYEGDILLASEARYQETLLSDPDSDDIPVYYSDHDKPLPAPDVPWFKAVVEWNETMCGFWLRYLDKRADWGPAVSTRLTDKMYRYEVAGNIHEVQP